MNLFAILFSVVSLLIPFPAEAPSVYMDGPVIVANTTTVAKANAYDYTDTISYSGGLMTPFEINKKVKAYGVYGNTPGMTEEEYFEAMSYEWVDVTPKAGKFRYVLKADVDLTKRYTYEELVRIERRFSLYDGVSLYRIGESALGKPMYALEVDLTEDKANRHTVLLTGQVHARETAGPVFILKELIDIVNAYYAGDTEARKALADTRFIAVICVNPDGHDGIGYDKANWTYSDGVMWKANVNGADLNRNYPGLSWMLTAKGIEKTKYTSGSAKKIYYPGDSAGSEPETKAMMKFYQYFIGAEHAEMLIDYHQQGRISYAGKYYGTKHMNELSASLRKALYATQKTGKLGKCYGYPEATDEDTYKSFGRCGAGSTNTDYAWAVALGTKFSTSYGFSVYVDEGWKEYTILEVPQRDKTDIELQGIAVPDFRSFSWEIGYGVDYLGYSESTLKLLEKEYYNYAFDKMLYTYAEQARLR